MFKLTGLLILVFAVIFQQHTSRAAPTVTEEEIDQIWANYKTQYGLVYTSIGQEMSERVVFGEHYRQIVEHNSNPHRTFDMAVNQFTRMNEAQRRAYTGEIDSSATTTHAPTTTAQRHKRAAGLRGGTTASRSEDDLTTTQSTTSAQTTTQGTTGGQTTTQSSTAAQSTTTQGTATTTTTRTTTTTTGIPDSFDWTVRASGEVQVVHAPKNQLSCGSCWAFSAVGVIEGAYALKKGEFKTFSEQQFVDCSSWNSGCNGGNVYYAIDDFKTNGSALESEYPYQAADESCSLNMTTSRANFEYDMTPQYRSPICNNATACTYDEEDLKEWLYTYGPISVSFYVVNDFYSYSSGIYSTTDTACDGSSTNHAVLLVGYGIENGVKFWRMKNSWGTNWGDNGYAKFPRDGSMMCNFARRATWVNLTPR